MSGHDYLQGILNGQRVSPQAEDALRRVRDKIEGDLRRVYGSTPRFYYGGSFGKQTMISESYDLDLVMYFPSTEQSSLLQIFSSVHQTLVSGGYQVQPKTVSLQLPYQGGFHVDVVPGRAQDSTFKYATLFKNTSPSSTLQTSLKVHIDNVRRVKEVVKLMKLWRIRHGVGIKTFAVELLTDRALAGKRVDDLGRSMLNALEFIRDNVLSVRLVDPANSNNVIELDYGARWALQRQAAASCAAQYWRDVVW